MKDNTLSIGILQLDTIWMDIDANLDKIERHFQGAGSLDLVVCPEMFNVGYIMDPTEIPDTQANHTIDRLTTIAAAYSTVICGSVPRQHANGCYYNDFIFVDKDSLVDAYNKVHLFSPAGEAKHYQKGSKIMDIMISNCKIRPLVCYDLRFPHVSYNDTGYDLLLYTANWPKARIDQWTKLLMGRAIENQSYTVGVNRTGKDKNGFTYTGQSCAIDYKGNMILQTDEKEGLSVINIDLHEQKIYRKTLPFLNDFTPLTK